ncbi:MAG: gliding motility-associated C-terminal domain-containing protein [Bacteroidota bacterium]
MADVCLPISPTDLTAYSITDNGNPYIDGISACDFDTSFVYDYQSLPGAGSSGPFRVDSWQVDGNSFGGNFNDIPDLLDSLNNWDPSGSWTQDAVAGLIQGGSPQSTYSDLAITQIGSGFSYVLQVTMNLNPNGSLIQLDTGFHQLILVDVGASCSDTVNVIVNCVNCPYIFEGNPVFDLASCNDMANVCLEIPFADLASYSIVVNGATYTGSTSACNADSSYSYDFTSLFAEPGPYLLQGWTVDGTMYLGSFNDVAHLVDSMAVWDPAAGWQLDFANSTIVSSNWTGSNYSDINLRLTNSSVIILQLDLTLSGGNTQVELPQGNHDFEVTNNSNSCQDIFSITVNCNDGFPSCNAYSGATELMTDNCDQPATLCTDIAMMDWSTYRIYINGFGYNGTAMRCGDQLDTLNLVYRLSSDAPPRTFDLIDWQVDGQSFSATSLGSFNAMINLMNTWDPTGGWSLNSFNQIEGGDLSKEYGAIILSVGVNSPTSFPASANVQPTNAGIELDTGNYRILFLNPGRLCTDTVDLAVRCNVINCPDIVEEDNLEAFVADCNETASICLDVTPADWNAYSVTLDGRPYTGTVEGCSFVTTGYSFTLDFLSSATSADVFSINFWLVNGTDRSGQFKTAGELLTLLNSWDAAANWAYDASTQTFSTTNPDGSYGSIPILSLPAGTISQYRVTADQMATATSVRIPVGEHSLLLTDGSNGCDDEINISVSCIESSSLRDTIAIQNSDTICIATNDLPGTPSTMSNACESGSGEYVSFELIADQFCVAYNGIDVGTDSACVVICDDQNNCDTTYLYVTVIDTTEVQANSPVVGVDTASITQGQVAIVPILDNDQYNGELTELYLVDEPANGFAVLNADSTLTYTPNEDFCNSTQPDVLTYAICNVNGCDTGQVTVLVYCSSIHVFSGFSPNNDGTNDTFVIEGLQDYPDNQVSVFNRWGNQVYTIQNYDNSNGWNGTFRGVDLPDGTYFYTIESDGGIIKSGYVQLRR